MRIAERYKIGFIAFFVLAVYYPAIFAGLNSVDDSKLFLKIGDPLCRGPLSLFMPSSGFYYRPLLMLTFYTDHVLWGQEASFYHLENILIHCANAILVFLITRRALAKAIPSKFELPLLAALLFAIHPINTESVNWISGRTDILATFFVLLSTLFLLRGIERRRLGWVFASSIIFICGVMSKEMVLFFIVAAILLIWRWSSEKSEDDKAMQVFRNRALAGFSAPYFIGAIVYMLWRFMRHAGHDAGIKHLLNHYHYDFVNTVRISLKVFGFYVKKLFIPVPLNFAITQVSEIYVVVGIMVVTLFFLLLRRQGMGTLFLMMAFVMIMPAVLITLGRVAWTPLAERYLYLPSAFFAIAIAGFVAPFFTRVNAKLLTFVALLLLIIATSVTVQRNLLWADGLAFFQDVHNKSSGFGPSYNELAIALMDEGNLDEAEFQLLEGERKFGFRQPLLYVNHARLEMMRNDMEAARAILLKTFKDKSSAHIEILKMLARVDEKRLMAGMEIADVAPDLVDTYAKMADRIHVPELVYRRGQLLLSLGCRREAADAFAIAAEQAPEAAFYKKAAFKLAHRLKADLK